MAKNKKNNNIKNMCILLLVLVCALLAVEFSGIIKQKKIITIPDGAGLTEISEILKSEKCIGNKQLFCLYSLLTGRTYYAGVHILDGMSYPSIAETLSTPVSEKTVTVTFREGIELREICSQLVELGLCTEEEFYQYAQKEYYDYAFLADIPNRENPLEGYLFPDTYAFSYQEGVQSIINKMLGNFEEKVAKPLYQDIADSRLTVDDVVIMASILEREAASRDELKKISGVFYNRLNCKGESRGYLESCATVQYILQERKSVLSVSDTQIDSPYNTYKYKGLPIGPIAEPGYAAIEAAIYPDETDALYFVADGNGKHYFAATFAEHQENMRKAGV